MKKILLTLCAMAGVLSFSYAQAPRLIVVEHFTQASCGPCAVQNPALKALLDQNTTKVVPIKYQTSWPGVDPMNAHNPTQVANRVTYYNVSGVPSVRMDGNVVSGSPGSINQTNINNRHAVTSPYELTVTKTINGNSIEVNAKIKKVGASSVNAVLQLLVVEKEIIFQTPPGSNGELGFHNVMKQMLPTQLGTTVPGTMAVNDSMSVSASWNMTNVYNRANIEVVGFIQNNATKEIIQGGYTGLATITGTEASLTRIVDQPSSSCSGNFTQRLRIRNNGSTNLTSATINYAVNGATVASQPWAGFLAPGASANIVLPTLSMVNGANNYLAYLSNVNNVVDLNQANDTMAITYNYTAPVIDQLTLSSSTFTFELATDRYGSETTWSLTDNTATVLYSGGPYTNLASNTIQVQPTQTWTLPQGQCINFTILDSYGDGICCGFGAGYYRLRHNGVNVYTGGSFTSADRKFFQINGVSGLENELGGGKLAVYPNPSSGLVRIELPLNGTAQIALQVYNLMGQEVMNVQDGQVNGELFVRELDLSQLAGGMYLIRLSQDGKQVVRKIELSK